MRISEYKPIVLASASPRRSQLLQAVGIAIEVIPSQIEEDELPLYLLVNDYPRYYQGRKPAGPASGESGA